MAEIEEAVQIAEVVGEGIVGMGSVAVKTTELGIKVIKAILAFVEKKRHEALVGEVAFEKLNRFESGQLSVCRFEEIDIEQIRPVLDQFGVPYAVMPPADINGVHYTQVSFGKSYTDRMNAVLQTLKGKGEIITERTQAPKIKSGEVSIEVLKEQEGVNVMVCRFEDIDTKWLQSVLNKFGILYAVMPPTRINGIECTQIAFAKGQMNQMTAVLQGFKGKGEIITERTQAPKIRSGEVSMQVLQEQEGVNNVMACRFESTDMEQLRPVLGQFGVLYAVSPDAEINGIHYTQVTFAKSHMNQMAAVLQTLGGKGEIITERTQPAYINSGEVAYDVLLEQDQNIMICQFDEQLREQTKKNLTQYGIKFAELPDLNLHDGKFEIAFPPKQQILVQAMLTKWKHGALISFEDYANNAEPDTLDKCAAEYDQHHLTPDQFQIVSETDENTVLEVPTISLMFRGADQDPVIAPNKTHGIFIPQTDREAVAEDKGKLRITLHKNKDYQTLLPDGSSGTKKKGEEILKELQELIRQAEIAREAALPKPIVPDGRDMHERIRKL